MCKITIVERGLAKDVPLVVKHLRFLAKSTESNLPTMSIHVGKLFSILGVTAG